MIEHSIEYYYTVDGKIPYREWFYSLKDEKTIAIIHARLARVRVGNMGDCVPVGEGVFELKIHFGPGYRLYFGQIGYRTVLLLYGGTKKTQVKDITRAKEYWRDYRRRLS